MHSTDQEFVSLNEWKRSIFKIAKIALAFSVVSFFVGYFVYHPPTNWIMPAIVLFISYFLCIVAGVYYLIKSLPLPILMLLVPIAPLFILIYVVLLITFLQRFT